MAADGGEIRFVLVNTKWLLLAGAGGEVTWLHPVEPAPIGECQNPPAVGDVDGDGRPEIVTCEERDTSAFDLDGNLLWRHRYSAPGGSNGGHSMADLDADGRYEVIHLGQWGLRVLDGATGAVLAKRTDVFTRALQSDPIIADVDGDGSAEIVVAGDWITEDGEPDELVNDHLFVFGAATGRWARTRPVWNQTAYDITTIRDDGSIVRFPRTSWQTYNAYRAQPSHDGDRPDLTLEVTDACADTCGPGGTVYIGVQASNLGSREAPAGASIHLHTWSAAAGVKDVGAATIDDAIPSMASPEGVVQRVRSRQRSD